MVPAPPDSVRAVTYVITMVSEDGTEWPYWAPTTTMVDSDGRPTGIFADDLYVPYAWGDGYMTSQMKMTFTGGAPPGLKQLKFYRAEGHAATGGFALVGSIRTTPDKDVYVFVDYGIEGDISSGPPIDTSLMGIDYAYPEAPFNIGSDPAPTAINCMANYQERAFLGAGRKADLDQMVEATRRAKAGDCMVSKLGAFQFSRPLVIKNTEAFQFSVPLKDPYPVVGMLSEHRLTVMTERATYLIAGNGEQGIVTPMEVNPLKISDEGCSARVPPKSVGPMGVWINANHTKLMAVTYGGDGSVGVRELSRYSSHFIHPGIREMETLMTGNGDNQVFFLYKDGSMAMATISDDGTAGFSSIELPKGARALSLFSIRTARSLTGGPEEERFDTLGAIVEVRGVVMSILLSERVDSEGEGVFADFAILFGAKLNRVGAKGYVQHQQGIGSKWRPPEARPVYINLTASDWSPGSPIVLTCSEGLTTRDEDDISIRYFYDEDGLEKSIILRPDWSTEDASSDYTVTVYCDVEVPEALRDVEGQGLSAESSNLIRSRWLPASKRWDRNPAPLRLLYLSLDEKSHFDYDNKGFAWSEGSYPVAVSGDGRVISSPGNPHFSGNNIELSHDGTSFELGEFPVECSWGYYGIPIESEMETLPIEPSDNRTLSDAKKIVNAVGLALHQSGNSFVGAIDAPIERMSATVQRNETDLTKRDKLFSGHTAPTIESRWTEEGRIRVKHVDPAPLNIMAIYPKGLSGD